MKRILSLLLSVFIASCMLVIAVSAEDTSATEEKVTEIYTSAECHDMVAEVNPNNDDNESIPYAQIHCQNGSDIGRYVKEAIGEPTVCGQKTDACHFGVIGGTDICYQYMQRYREYCTLCAYNSTYSVLWWGDWNCIK